MPAKVSTFQASLLDRLVDDSWQPLNLHAGVNLADLKKNLFKDIEDLLNTRHNFASQAENWKELRTSLLVYGLPDLTKLNAQNEGDLTSLLHFIEFALRTFEKRLTRIRVSSVPQEGDKRGVRFHIDAYLRTEPRPTPITFDTILDKMPNEVVVPEAHTR